MIRVQLYSTDQLACDKSKFIRSTMASIIRNVKERKNMHFQTIFYAQSYFGKKICHAGSLEQLKLL